MSEQQPAGPADPTDSSEPGQPWPRPERRAPSPYMLSVILFTMGLWFLYDGFFNAEFIAKHEGDPTLAFNRYGALALLGWAVLDFYWMRRRQRRRAAEQAAP